MTVQVSHINKANIKGSYNNQVIFTNKNLDIVNLKKDFTEMREYLSKIFLKKRTTRKVFSYLT